MSICAKKMVPLNKIPGEENTADLMTKHLGNPVILKHMKKLGLYHTEGRAGAAAQLHSVEVNIESAEEVDNIIEKHATSTAPIPDHWSEKGERGRWVRIHSTPRTERFDATMAVKGPGRRTKLQNIRVTKGVYIEGNKFKEEDDWENPDMKRPKDSRPWVGETIFLVDRKYSKEFGTDQRRQRDAFKNKTAERVSWADLEFED